MAELARPRNIASERAILRDVCRGLINPDEFIRASEARAREFGEHYGTVDEVTLGRDLVQEAINELLDARNYITWWIEDNPDDPTVPEKQAALLALCVAYNQLKRGTV